MVLTRSDFSCPSPSCRARYLLPYALAQGLIDKHSITLGVAKYDGTIGTAERRPRYIRCTGGNPACVDLELAWSLGARIFRVARELVIDRVGIGV